MRTAWWRRALLTDQWGGVAYALPEQREPLRLAEVNKYADSFCTNAHKWGLVGFDCCKFTLSRRHADPQRSSSCATGAT
jgi:glutamate/tyrosine decarboxylase-like PLP-dependent enzyme